MNQKRYCLKVWSESEIEVFQELTGFLPTLNIFHRKVMFYICFNFYLVLCLSSSNAGKSSFIKKILKTRKHCAFFEFWFFSTADRASFGFCLFSLSRSTLDHSTTVPPKHDQKLQFLCFNECSSLKNLLTALILWFS